MSTGNKYCHEHGKFQRHYRCDECAAAEVTFPVAVIAVLAAFVYGMYRLAVIGWI